MHVVIVGCGRVGSSLALELTRDGHTVAVVDRRVEAFDRFLADWDGIRIVGEGFDRDRLVEAGIDRAEALAAVTSGDNSNIIVARIARETFGIERVVARIYDPRRAVVYERLGIATVATVEWTTDQVLRRLLPDSLRAEWVHPSAGMALAERGVPPAWVGRRIRDLDVPGRWRAVGLVRLGRAAIPNGDVLLQEGDALLLAVAGDAFDELEAVLADAPAGGGH